MPKHEIGSPQEGTSSNWTLGINWGGSPSNLVIPVKRYSLMTRNNALSFPEMYEYTVHVYKLHIRKPWMTYGLNKTTRRMTDSSYVHRVIAKFSTRFWKYLRLIKIPLMRTSDPSKSSIFSDITPCSPLNVIRPFGGTSSLNHQPQRISQDRSDMFLWNVGWLSNISHETGNKADKGISGLLTCQKECSGF
jgi:hypothetical protein